MTRNRLLVAAAIVVVAAVIVVLILTNGSNKTNGPTSSPMPTVKASQSADAAPTGCLGGRGRDAAMLLAAQKAAPHTTNGAVELATAMVRWSFRYPGTSVGDAQTVSDAIISSTASAKFKDLAGTAAQNPNTSGGAVPDGTPFYLSTSNGVWHVESNSTDAVAVSIGAVYVVNGAVSPQLRSSTTFSLVWERGAWRIKSGSIDRTTEDLFRIGEAFTGGADDFSNAMRQPTDVRGRRHRKHSQRRRGGRELLVGSVGQYL